MRCFPAVALATLLLAARGAVADEIVLVGGGRLSGEVVGVTADSVRIRLPHGEMELPRSRVARIVREERPDWLRREARESLQRGSTLQAVELGERALAARPGDATLRRELAAALNAHAKALVDRFELAAARATVARLAELDPQDAGTAALAARIEREKAATNRLFAEASDLVRRGEFERALEVARRYRLRRPENDPHAREALARAHLGAAVAAADAGALRASLDHLRAARAWGAEEQTREALFLLQPVVVLEALREGDADEAWRALRRIEGRYPDRAVPVFLAAVIHHVTGEVEQAVAAYAEAARVAGSHPPPDRGVTYELIRRYATATLRAAIAEPPQEGAAKWRETFLGPLERGTGARRFVVWAPSQRVAEETGRAADGLYEEYARELLGAVPEAGPIELVVHSTREAYLAADPAPPGTALADVMLPRTETAGVCYDTTGPDGRPLIRIEVYWDGGRTLLDDTLPHEIVHAVQRRGLRAFRRGKWLDEGLAMLHESNRGRAERRALWVSLRSDAFPLPELLAMRSIPPGRAALFYTQSLVFTEFLRGLGDEAAWRRFLERMGSAGFERAISDAWGVESVDRLERMWLAQ